MTVLRHEVFTKLPADRLRIYAVWEPILPSDNAARLDDGLPLLASDPRASQYWDPRSEIGRLFVRALDLPMTTPAWDVYLLYGPGDLWKSAPPQPAFWMHQIDFLPFSDAARRFAKQRLDGARFRSEVEKLLAANARAGS